MRLQSVFRFGCVVLGHLPMIVHTRTLASSKFTRGQTRVRGYSGDNRRQQLRETVSLIMRISCCLVDFGLDLAAGVDDGQHDRSRSMELK